MKTGHGGRKMLTLLGKGVSPGLAKGRAYVYQDLLLRDSELYLIDRSQIHEEKARIEKAIGDVRKCLAIDAKQIEGKLNRQSAELFRVQETILLESSVIDEMKRVLDSELLNAEQAVRTAFRTLAHRFRDLDDEVLREWGDDIDDLCRRLLLSLTGINSHSLEKLPSNTVLVVRRLLPSDTVFLARSSNMGVLAEFAGTAAHSLLLARELKIPCVGGIPDLLETVNTGDLALINGTTGEAVINPGNRALKNYRTSFEDV